MILLRLRVHQEKRHKYIFHAMPSYYQKTHFNPKTKEIMGITTSLLE